MSTSRSSPSASSISRSSPVRASDEPTFGSFRRAFGTSGEALVAGWYEAAGYEVLDRNWRCREGELDLVLRRGNVVVFCEVKTRRGDAYGTPAEAVTRTKQQRIRTLALRWLEARQQRSDELRFDVAAVILRPQGRPEIDVVEAAF